MAWQGRPQPPPDFGPYQSGQRLNSNGNYAPGDGYYGGGANYDPSLPAGANGPGGPGSGGFGGIAGAMPVLPARQRTGNRGNLAGPAVIGNGGMMASRAGFQGTITGAGHGGGLQPRVWDAGGTVAPKMGPNPVASNAAYQAKRGMQASLTPNNAALLPYYIR